MQPNSITVTFKVNRSPQEVFCHILDIPNWWTTDFAGANQKIGDEFTIHHPGQHFSRQQVIESDPGKRIVWLVTESNMPWIKGDQQEWTNTRMVFDLTKAGNETLVHFVHEGLTPDKECFARVEEGWNLVIGDKLFNSLKYTSMQNYQSTITVKLAGEEAIKRICNVTDWWGVSMEGKPSQLNDNFIIRMGSDAFFNMTVSELDPGKKMVWSITDCYMPWYKDKKEWANTKLIFQCTPRGNETELQFTHEGLTPKSECWKDCEPGWTHWIQTSLFSYLTTGKGVFRAPTK